MIQRVDLKSGAPMLPTRVTEQPLVSAGPSVFTRTLAPLANGNAIIALTASGFTALSSNFDAATAANSSSATDKAQFGTTAFAGIDGLLEARAIICDSITIDMTTGDSGVRRDDLGIDKRRW